MTVNELNRQTVGETDSRRDRQSERQADRQAGYNGFES